MDEELRRLRGRLIRDRGGGEQRPRFPRELRQEVAEFARRQSQAGETFVHLSDALGVGRSTLQHWVKQFPNAPQRNRLRPVTVFEPLFDQGDTPVLVLPDGSRVEGLSLESLITVLRGLR